MKRAALAVFLPFLLVSIGLAQPGGRYPASNELGILSNFAATPFTYRGQHYASVEGFWQMVLYPEGRNDSRVRAAGIQWPHTRAEVA